MKRTGADRPNPATARLPKYNPEPIRSSKPNVTAEADN